MSSATWDSFERYRTKGLDARRAGRWEAARIYLLEAARLILELSKQAQGDALQEARRQTAERLLELARDCETARKENRRPGTASPRRAQEREASNDGEKSADDWLVQEKPNVRFEHVAGLDDVKEEIRLRMIYPLSHPEMAQRYNIKAGGGVLMYGPPGTGKTLLARATAGELDAAFFRVSAADMLSKWVGEAEQNIRKLFDAAERQRSVIFIDEIESLIPARRDEGSSVMQRVVPQVLQGMEGFDKKDQRQVLFMGATNVPWQLDPAVLRPGRFDEKVYIPLPDQPARLKMLEIYLKFRPVDERVDLHGLADRLAGYSGADIKYICDRSATIPFIESISAGEPRAILSADFDAVIRDTRPSVQPETLGRFEEWARQVS